MNPNNPIYKVLIVDDVPTNLRILEILLKQKNCEVQAFTDPQDCLDYLNSDDWRPDLVILDYQMPKMNGDELAVALRSLSINCHILILTAYASLARNELESTARISGIMNKPISKTDVAYILHRWSQGQEIKDSRSEGRTEITEPRAIEVFFFIDGIYQSAKARINNTSSQGISLIINNDQQLEQLAPGIECILESGGSYSIRWSRQRADGLHLGAALLQL